MSFCGCWGKYCRHCSENPFIVKQFIASEINSPIQAPLDQFLSQQAIHQPLHGGVNGNYFSLKPLKVFVIVTVFELVFLLVRSCFHIFGEGGGGHFESKNLYWGCPFLLIADFWAKFWTKNRNSDKKCEFNSPRVGGWVGVGKYLEIFQKSIRIGKPRHPTES